MNASRHIANGLRSGRCVDRAALDGASSGRATFGPRTGGARRPAPSAAVLSLVFVSLAAAPLCGQTVWELDRYEVKALTAFSPAAELTPQLEAALHSDLVERADTLVGGPWSITAAAADGPLRRAILADLGLLEFEQLGGVGADLDKLFLLRVRPGEGRWEVAVREFDVRTRVFGPVVTRRAGQVSKLRDVALGAMLDAFAPLGRIERVEGDDNRRVAVRLKAAALPTRDESLGLVEPGDVFRPVFRYYDRDGNFRRADLTPWTFLTLDALPERQQSPGEVFCRLYSGLRNPLSARRRGRVEPLVLGTVPTGRPTTLALRSRTDPERALAGYEVYAHPPGVKSTTLLGTTGREGDLMVPPGSSPLRLAIVKNGGRLLARLPIVPGLEKTVTAEIADDEGRLEAEGIITGLQERLVDMVAGREVVFARVKSRIEAGKFDEARELIDELRRMPTAAEFRRLLEDQKARVRSDDPTVQARIDALFADTHKLIAKHLDTEPIEQLWQDLRAAQGEAGG